LLSELAEKFIRKLGLRDEESSAEP
jgi:hypothetical protein